MSRRGAKNIIKINSDRQTRNTSTKSVIKNGGDAGNIDATFLLKQIQKKFSSSSALGDGFDVLLVKIDKIEENQEKISSKVDLIHEAIYHPDEGLFSRINSVKSDNIGELDKKIQQIESWKASKSASVEEEKDLKKKVEAHQVNLDNIESWKKNVNSLGKWILVALAGGALSLGFRALYELYLIK